MNSCPTCGRTYQFPEDGYCCHLVNGEMWIATKTGWARIYSDKDQILIDGIMHVKAKLNKEIS